MTAADLDMNQERALRRRTQEDEEPKWHRSSWAVAGTILSLSIVGLFALVGYTLWQTLTWLRVGTAPSEQFVLTAIALTTAGMLRYLAMLIGTALASGGLLVSFLTINQAIGLSAKTGGSVSAISGGLKTNSPGVVAITVGAVIVVGALFATTSFTSTMGAPRTTTIPVVATASGGPMPSVAELTAALAATTPTSGASK